MKLFKTLHAVLLTILICFPAPSNAMAALGQQVPSASSFSSLKTWCSNNKILVGIGTLVLARGLYVAYARQSKSIYDLIREGKKDEVQKMVSEQPNLIKNTVFDPQDPFDYAILTRQWDIVQSLVPSIDSELLLSKIFFYTKQYSKESRFNEQQNFLRTIFKKTTSPHHRAQILKIACEEEFSDQMPNLFDDLMQELSQDQKDEMLLSWFSEKTLRRLIEHGAQIHKADDPRPYSPLHVYSAAIHCPYPREEQAKCLSFLLEQPDIQVNCKDKDSATPLMWACRVGNEDSMLMLLEHNADINVRKADGKTPLMIALEQKNVLMILALCGWDSNPDISDASGKTAWDYGLRKLLNLYMESNKRYLERKKRKRLEAPKEQ